MFIFIQCKWKVKVTWNTYIMFYHVNVFVQLLRYCIEFLKFLSFSFFFVSYKYLSYTVYVRILLFSVTLFPAYSSVCKVCKSSPFPTSVQYKSHNVLSSGTQQHGLSPKWESNTQSPCLQSDTVLLRHDGRLGRIFIKTNNLTNLQLTLCIRLYN